MLSVKTYSDELSLFNSPCDDDLNLKVLHGLGDEYQGLSDAIKARDTSLSFEELHEELTVREAQLLHTPSRQPFPITANAATKLNQASRPPNNRSQSSSHSPQQNHSNNSSLSNYKPRPYKGYCHLCGEQGYSAKR